MRFEKLYITDYQPQYANNFRDLNLEWLETYFYVETHDHEVLNNVQSYIIDKGGYIFFAILNEKVVGTVALMNEAEGYELSKMAVDRAARGNGVGQFLMEYCINFAKEKAWPSLHLYSNRKLENSIHIYKKYGFVEVDLEKESPYERSDIKMSLHLADHH